jgi:hypothetical protein
MTVAAAGVVATAAATAAAAPAAAGMTVETMMPQRSDDHFQTLLALMLPAPWY